MGGFSGLLRTLVLASVFAAVSILLARYLFDALPTVPAALAGIEVWIRTLTQPVLGTVSLETGIPQGHGLWNPLPLGLAVACLLAGVVGINFIDFLFGPPGATDPDSQPAPRPRPRKEEPAPAVLPPAQAESPAAPAPAPTPAPPSPPPPAQAAFPAADPHATVATVHPVPEQPVASTTFSPQAQAAAVPVKMPERIGRYEITAELGRGAMGVVYKATDPQIGRTVAIKTIGGAIADQAGAAEFKKRFFAEARAAGRLNHPGIMKVHDLLEDATGHPCLVLEFFDGKTLDQVVKKGRPTLATSLKIVTQAAQALAFAHEHGVVHRDIKPGNIMVSANGHAVIADFGIAKVEDINMTATGTIMGTPAFMSPEQVQGLPVDARTDIFSLGTVLYWLITGERPFAGSTFTTIAYNVVHSQHRPVAELVQDIPSPLDKVLARCLAKAPMDRYVSAHDLASALREVPFS